MGEMIDKQKVIDAINRCKSTRQNGHWVPVTLEGDESKVYRMNLDVVCKCSECGAFNVLSPTGTIVPMISSFKFCPCCGASMTEA